MSFIQIIEFTTSRAGELDALLDEWLEKTQGKRTATRGVEAGIGTARTRMCR